MSETNQHELAEKYPEALPVVELDGGDVRLLLRAAYDWLGHNYELVNRMNVFPVPDGDTGTNMLLTLKAAWASILDHGGDSAGGVMAAAAEGAHHGSRGNSGVILGQWLHGMAKSLDGLVNLSAADLVVALRSGSQAAYAAVPSPVEGTILTVANDVAAAAERSNSEDLRALLAGIVQAADLSVARTPDLLPVLKKAGVVDSGGKGLFYVLDGMYRALSGDLAIDNGDAHLGEVVESVVGQAIGKGVRDLPSTQWGFDVQFLVEKPAKPVAEILADISAMGDCPLVEGDENLVKVHVHVFDPGQALSYGVKLGFMTDVVVENMDDMAVSAQLGGEELAAAAASSAISIGHSLPEANEIGLIAVSPGQGFTSILHDLGVHAVVRGGQTMNPSTAQIAEAINLLPSRRIVILPNNGNIVMAAQQAAKLATEASGQNGADQDGHEGHTVIVAPSKTLPQGIAALLAYNPAAANLETLAQAMNARMAHVQTGEVTQAVRGGEFDGLTVEIGDIIGLHNGRLVLSASAPVDAVLELLTLMVNDEMEVVTLYYGDFIDQRAAENLVEQLRGVYSELDIEAAYGGQPHYFYILSAE